MKQPEELIQEIEQAVKDSNGELEFFLPPDHLALLVKSLRDLNAYREILEIDFARMEKALTAMRLLNAFRVIVEGRIENPEDPVGTE